METTKLVAVTAVIAPNPFTEKTIELRTARTLFIFPLYTLD